MSEFYIVSVGDIPQDWIETAHVCIGKIFGLREWRLMTIPVPDDALDRQREQYSAPVILQAVLRSLPADRNRALAVTACDLFIPMLTFLFGQAQLGGRVALVSGARLNPQFYGLPQSGTLVAERLRKEILHEVGHTLGLVHCLDKGCAMSLSNSVLQVDIKEDSYCGGCRSLVEERLALERLEGVI